ncbi:MAG: MFS transporter [Caldiserica bacterium]|nr:MFS transporter [Caldisericota bacterium]
MIASAIFGLSIGLYDFLLPFYLDTLKISYGNMGVIFSFSAIFLFFIRIYAGQISDFIGRKHFFSLSLLLSAFSNLFTPFFSTVAPQILLRSLRETSRAIKETIQQVLVFEQWKDKFRHLIAWTVGSDFTFQGFGVILGGFLLVRTGYKFPFILIGIITLLTTLLFIFRFEEKFTPSHSSPFSWTAPFKHRLPRPLILITISGFILMIGVSASHSFILPLFFYHKFSVSPSWVALILAFHRFSLGIPMILSGKIVKWNLKATTIIFIFLQGVTISLTAVPSNFLLASIVWLTHDLVGASFWVPARNTLIQHYARDGKRGLEVAIVMSLSGLGWILGPLIAGVVSKYSINYPFIISGIIISLSVIPLFWLERGK